MSWHHGDYLALAQAVSALLAVVAAFVIVFLQHRLEEKRRLATERANVHRVLRIAAAFVSRAHKAVRDISAARNDVQLVEREVDRKKYRSQLLQLLEAMNGLVISDMPTATSAEQLIRARSELAAASFEMSKHRDTDGVGSNEYGAPWLKWEARLVDAAKILREEAAKFGE